MGSPLWICSRTPTCRRRWRRRPSCSTPTRPSPSTSTGRQRLLSYSSSFSSRCWLFSSSLPHPGEVTVLLLPVTELHLLVTEPRHQHMEVPDILTADLMTYTARRGPSTTTSSPLLMLTPPWNLSRVSMLSSP